MGIDRRNAMITVGLAALPGLAGAQTVAGDEIIDLWPGPPPGRTDATIVRSIEPRNDDPAHPDRWVSGIDRPVMVVRRPARPNGAAMLVMPGGGYGFLSYDNEGTSQAAWLNARGITAFILLYRLPAEGWKRREDVPLQDAQRAMRLIRARARTLGVDPGRLGALGFSAGGHLAGSLATRHGEQVYGAVDDADRLSARPDIAGLGYPVVSLDAPFTHAGSRDNLLGPASGETLRRSHSVDRRVDGATPPLFIFHAADDTLVPPANALALFSAMEAAKRPVALHLFEDGGHGFGVKLPKTMQGAVWPDLFASFAAGHGLPGA
ncbi:alpha/beta hydrolase [Sphingobium sp. CCH11-B1]|jgi:acetyl esterase/lipase|uniref:alpha/beta hydrolase n=1 Tax=Sphingobium sp. CCH11-B1 TaxID=1768781 RepID=UPI000A72D7DA|nr:alpha/beta hydrolase [Sphingobium sp. CCH11-B1]MEA3390889.1 alpha/beta hydrolase [Pseudomonadota bacterium]